jgi:hypothetical protein
MAQHERESGKGRGPRTWCDVDPSEVKRANELIVRSLQAAKRAMAPSKRQDQAIVGTLPR